MKKQDLLNYLLKKMKESNEKAEEHRLKGEHDDYWKESGRFNAYHDMFQEFKKEVE